MLAPVRLLNGKFSKLTHRYDFYIFGTIASTTATQFFASGNAVDDTIAWLATFAVGFIVRPFGALVFGRLGDVFGRKYTFLVTMLIMGICTALVGCLPTRDGYLPDGVRLPNDAKWVSSLLLILLRILQGLAIGGEYGGAAVVSHYLI